MPELRILSPKARAAFISAVSRGEIFERIPRTPDDPLIFATLTAAEYLRYCGICYRTTVSASHRHLSARELYRSCSDGRHGGLLDLPPRGVRAFHDWFFGNRYAGSHPFEIWRDAIHFFVEPILFPASEAFWLRLSCRLSGRIDPYLIRMALALHGAGVPFSFQDCQNYATFACGDDWVGVADDSVWDAGEPVWPKGVAMLPACCDSLQVSQLTPYPAALKRVEWIADRTTVTMHS